MVKRKIREIRIEGNLAFVPLTHGYEAVIDAADVQLVDAWTWCAHIKKHTVYATRTDCSGEKRRRVYMHRVILNAASESIVDHINSDGIDNRRANLRFATKLQNAQNTRLRKDNSSGYKGVYLHKPMNTWRARIRVDGKKRDLGYFKTPEEAHAAYCAASEKFHKEFGRAK